MPAPKQYVQKFQEMFQVHQRGEFRRFMEMLEGPTVLDLGAGGGDHARYFADQGLDVTCIDIAEEMVEICRQKSLRAELMDLEHLSFQPNSFDGIWAVCSLLHVPKQGMPTVAASLYRVLRRRGLLYACVKEQREGESDGMVCDQKGNQRFFALWKEDTFAAQFTPRFSLIESRRVVLGDRRFLEFLFRKKTE